MTTGAVPRLIFAALLLLPQITAAQEISGPARASDGDTLVMTGITIRLYGIDAPELGQTCRRDGAEWTCGREAAGRLAGLVAGQEVECQQHDIDAYGRAVASCRVGGTDLAAALVDAGLAVALPRFTAAYVENEARAREQRRGLWRSDFQRPAEYRADRRPPRQPPPHSPSLSRPAASPPAAGVFYRGCNDVRAAGAAPLYRGQPGYRPEMDGDRDGIACEPFRGR